MSSVRNNSTQELLQQMASSVVPVEEPERAEARREQVVARLEALHDEIGDRRRRTQRRTRRFAVLAAAAAPLLALGGYGLARHSAGPAVPAVVASAPAQLSVQSGSVLLARGAAAERPVRGSATLAAGDRVRTGRDGHADLQMHSGTDVEMSPVTELTLGAETAGWRSERVDLGRGSVDVTAPVLPSDGSFEVVTPDTSVDVNGAELSVTYRPNAAGGPTTLVAVRDGKALVRSQGARTVLEPGQHWSSRPVAAPAASGSTPSPSASAKLLAPNPSAAAKSPPAAKRHAETPVVKAAGGTKLPSVTSASSLAEQNRLFQAAMDARRAGNDARALSLLNQLLTRYPGSPLEQDARVERFRALKRLGKSDAATRAARRYLAEHPDGFARDEARRMAIGPDGG